ncbi:hypothetical protein ACHQM5_013618 [Ranunculus cassubicifolius]
MFGGQVLKSLSKTSISRFSNPISKPYPKLISPSYTQNQKTLRYLSSYSSSPSVFDTSYSNASLAVRSFSTRTMNQSNSNKPPTETILLDGCDFYHWLVILESPEPSLTRDEIIDSYIKTLAQVLGSEDEARNKIYSVSTRHYFAFSCIVEEEVSNKIRELPKVRWVLPDSYLDVRNKDYGGEPFINGQAVPYDPKYHALWVDNYNKSLNRKGGDRRTRRDNRPTNRGNMPTRLNPSSSASPSSNSQGQGGLNQNVQPMSDRTPTPMRHQDMSPPVQGQGSPPLQNQSFQNGYAQPPAQGYHNWNNQQGRDFQSRDMNNQGFQNRDVPHQISNHQAYQYQNRDMPPPTSNQGYQNRDMTPPMNNPNRDNMPPPMSNQGYQNRNMTPAMNNQGYPTRDTPPPMSNQGYQNRDMTPPMNNQGYPNRDMQPPAQNCDFQNRDMPPPASNQGYQNRNSYAPQQTYNRDFQ